MCRQAVIQRHTVNDFNYYLGALKCILHMNTHTARDTGARVFSVVHAVHHPNALHQPYTTHAHNRTRAFPSQRIIGASNWRRKKLFDSMWHRKKKQSRYEKEKKRKERERNTKQN